MKYVAAVFVVITLLMSGCSLFDKVDDVTFDSSYAISYDVSVVNDSIIMEQVLNLTSDEEIAKYQNKLQSVTLDSAVMQVVNYSSTASENLLSGSVLYSATASTIPVDFAEYTNFALFEGASTKLNPSVTKINEVQNILLSQKAIKVYIRGKATNAANFTLKIYFYYTVKADALKK